MSDAWKTVTIPQKDFGTRSDDWLRGFEAGVAASQKPAADEIERLRAALTRIEKWFGEFPDTNQFWDREKKEPMNYAAAYGSNGERDFMRKIARDALESCAHRR